MARRLSPGVLLRRHLLLSPWASALWVLTVLSPASWVPSCHHGLAIAHIPSGLSLLKKTELLRQGKMDLFLPQDTGLKYSKSIYEWNSWLTNNNQTLEWTWKWGREPTTSHNTRLRAVWEQRAGEIGFLYFLSSQMPWILILPLSRYGTSGNVLKFFDSVFCRKTGSKKCHQSYCGFRDSIF